MPPLHRTPCQRCRTLWGRRNDGVASSRDFLFEATDGRYNAIIAFREPVKRSSIAVFVIPGATRSPEYRIPLPPSGMFLVSTSPRIDWTYGRAPAALVPVGRACLAMMPLYWPASHAFVLHAQEPPRVGHNTAGNLDGGVLAGAEIASEGGVLTNIDGRISRRPRRQGYFADLVFLRHVGPKKIRPAPAFHSRKGLPLVSWRQTNDLGTFV